MPEAPKSPRIQSVSRAAFVDKRLMTALMRAFGQHAGTDQAIDVVDLQRALGLKSEYLAARLLARFDRDGDGVVLRDDFLDGVQRLVLGSDHDKLRFAFKLHDHDDDGSLDLIELERMITLSLAESGVHAKGELSAQSLASVLLRDADTNGDGRISLEEFEAVVHKHPRILEKMTRSEALWIVPSEDLLARLEAPVLPSIRARFARWWANHWRAAVVVALWMLANGILFATTYASPGSDPLIALGNATGHCLSMNAALVLIPVLRRFTTMLRAAGASRLLPIDDAIDFHALVGHAMYGLAVVHTGAFLAAFTWGHGGGSLVHLVTGTVRGATGAVLAVAFTIMWVFALERVRRSHLFERFYFSHLLYVVWLIAAAVHEPRFLLWTFVPILGLLIEHVVRARRRGYATVALSAHALRSGVTQLEIARPSGFRFEPGDYAFLRIPAIAGREWHPYTISSPPESDALTFHVRSLGNWSGALRAHVETLEQESEPEMLAVYLDGPYGSPTAHLYRSRFAVLIGAGIGVTPFASVLGSLVRRAGTEAASKLQKGHFFWINRDQYSFEWFTDLLADVEMRDTGQLFDLHLFMTQGRSGATSAGLEAAREVTHAEGHSDVVTGLSTFTEMGPPDWKEELAAIRDRHAPDPVEVFFCGPPGLGTTLRKTCGQLGMVFHEERF